MMTGELWSIEQLLSLFVTLLVIVDPLAAVGIFMGLTTDAPARWRRRMAVNAHIVATATLIVFAVTGAEVLRLLGISLAAFRIAGGLLLLIIAVEMVIGERGARRNRSVTAVANERSAAEPDERSDIAVFPIGIPLLAGPGAIATVLLLSAGPHGESIMGMGTLIAFVILVLGASLLLFLAAGRITHLIGPSVTSVFTRLLGIMMAALATQFVVDGIRQAFLT